MSYLERVINVQDLDVVRGKYEEKVKELLKTKEKCEEEGSMNTEVYKNAMEQLELENAKGVLIVEMLMYLEGEKEIDEVNKY